MVGIYKPMYLGMGFPGGSDRKESACNVGDLGSIPGSGRSAGEGNGIPLQYSVVCTSKSGTSLHDFKDA